MSSKLLVVAIFGAISAAALNFLWIQMGLGPGVKALGDACPEPYFPGGNKTIMHPISAAHLKYTGSAALDHQICILVTFFTSAMKPQAIQTTYSLLFSLPTVAVFMAVESVREKRPAILAMPALFGLAYQNIGAGVVVPLYIMAYILAGSSNAKSHNGPGDVSRADAISILVGTIFGVLIPTYVMLTADNPYITAAWQAFPLWMALIQFLTKQIQPSDHTSGRSIVQLTYAMTFLASAISHLLIISSQLGNENTIKDVFLPSLTPMQTMDLALISKNFCQWDNVFIFGSTAAASLWHATTNMERGAVLLANLLLIPIFGPGSAFSAIQIWRESKSNSKIEI